MMDMKFSPAWLLKVAEEEEEVHFSVGGWAHELRSEFLDIPDTSETRSQQVNAALPIAREWEATLVQRNNFFGQLINLWRREKGITVQQLAETCELNPLELLLLEEGKDTPDIRTVSAIAKVFDIPARKLAQVAGLMEPDTSTNHATLAFAASANTMPLEPEQKTALREFIRALTTM